MKSDKEGLTIFSRFFGTTSLRRYTELAIPEGCSVTILHDKLLDDAQKETLRFSIADARGDATNAVQGLSSGNDSKEPLLLSRYKNSFRFDPTENHEAAREVLYKMMLLENGVNSSNLVIKLYPRLFGDDDTVGFTKSGLNTTGNPKICIKLAERLASDRHACSRFINHEISHNVANTRDYGEHGNGYATTIYIDNIGDDRVDIFLPDRDEKYLSTAEAIDNADSYATYARNRATIISRLARRGEQVAETSKDIHQSSNDPLEAADGELADEHKIIPRKQPAEIAMARTFDRQTKRSCSVR